MPEYLRLVRGGRPPSPELVEEMRHNYEAIGGRSPLTDLTFAQARALEQRLGPSVPVAVGMRNWRPFIAEALSALAAAGVTRVIAIPLAPQSSTLSVAKYFDAATKALTDGMRIERTESIPCSCGHSPSGSPRPIPSRAKRSSSRRTAFRFERSRPETLTSTR
jgi:ferrochelatase